jgi:hypothetical protein
LALAIPYSSLPHPSGGINETAEHEIEGEKAFADQKKELLQVFS